MSKSKDRVFVYEHKLSVISGLYNHFTKDKDIETGKPFMSEKEYNQGLYKIIINGCIKKEFYMSNSIVELFAKSTKQLKQTYLDADGAKRHGFISIGKEILTNDFNDPYDLKGSGFTFIRPDDLIGIKDTVYFVAPCNKNKGIFNFKQLGTCLIDLKDFALIKRETTRTLYYEVIETGFDTFKRYMNPKWFWSRYNQDPSNLHMEEVISYDYEKRVNCQILLPEEIYRYSYYGVKYIDSIEFNTFKKAIKTYLGRQTQFFEFDTEYTSELNRRRAYAISKAGISVSVLSTIKDDVLLKDKRFDCTMLNTDLPSVASIMLFKTLVKCKYNKLVDVEKMTDEERYLCYFYASTFVESLDIDLLPDVIDINWLYELAGDKITVDMVEQLMSDNRIIATSEEESEEYARFYENSYISKSQDDEDWELE